MDLPQMTVVRSDHEMPGNQLVRARRAPGSPFRIGPDKPKRIPKRLRDAGVTPEQFAWFVLRLGVDPGTVVEELKATEAARAWALCSRRQTVCLEDGTIGYFVRWPRKDDCQAAAIATVLEIPIGEVPDPRIDKRLAAGQSAEGIDRRACAELTRWLASRNLRMITHRNPPVARRRWIGVVEKPGRFQNHCLVMSHRECIFDPTRRLTDDEAATFKGMQIRQFGAEDVAYGLSFQATKTRSSN